MGGFRAFIIPRDPERIEATESFNSDFNFEDMLYFFWEIFYNVSEEVPKVLTTIARRVAAAKCFEYNSKYGKY